MRLRLKVKEVAERKGFSMGRLSKVSNVPYNTIKSIYRDPFYSITTITLGRIAGALEVDVSELVESVPSPYHQASNDEECS
jgi:lambda repressor-like predicted transcriptional regulator